MSQVINISLKTDEFIKLNLINKILLINSKQDKLQRIFNRLKIWILMKSSVIL